MNSGFSLPHKALILGARYTAFDRGVRSRFFLLLLSQWVFYSGFSYWVEYNSFNSTFCRVPNYLNVLLCRNYIMRRGHIRGLARINFFCP